MNLLSTVSAASFNLMPTQGVALSGITIERIVTFVITGILIVSGVVFFFMLLIGGIRWILSGGDKASTESARSQITSALVGLVIVFSAWAIGTLIQEIFPGTSIFTFDITAITN